MKIYLSASLARRDEMRQAARSIRKAGHTITCTWIDGNSQDGDVSGPELRVLAVHDLNEIRKSDGMICFTGEGTSGGRHVELGYALALNKWCMLVGPAENAFHWLAEIGRYDTLAQALEAL